MKRSALFLLMITTIACSSAKAPVDATSQMMLHFDNGTEPEYLDPGLLNDNKSHNISIALFEGLTTYHPKTLEALPGVAEKWTISQDGRKYTFFLREDAKWTDGKPVTAGDFVYAWQRNVNPKTASRSAPHLYPVKNAQAINQGKITDLNQLGIQALGDNQVIVTLEAPFPPFLELTSDSAYLPVRKDIIEKHGEGWTRPENIVSNGPFMLTAWTPHKHVIVKKNPQYWDAKNVYLSGIVFTPTEDHSTATKLFQAKQIDFMEQVPINLVDNFKNMPEFANTEQFVVYYYWLNCTNPILKDVRVRQALSLAIDRNVLVNQYLKGLKHPADKGLLPPGIKGYPYKSFIEFNPEKARKLLREAGYPDPSKIPELQILYNTNDDHKLVAEVIQQMLQTNLGLKISIQNMEWKVFLKELQKHNFEIARMGAVGEYVYPMPMLESFVSGAEGNFGVYSNPKFDKLWAQSLVASSASSRMQLYTQMEKIVMDDLPVIPLYYYKQTTLQQQWVRGLYRNVLLFPIFKWTWLTPRDQTNRPWDTVLEYTHIPWPKAA
ncbi:MAG: peptide ABC transporter substrate-binding protein [Deltaproteobacteria bacterium CG11_big_fil_rev_8_21_14_0_20_47_16]|nr:MAG: peptide ABC transporter substrate-binding protein [Deltaproteobacteria bacterium CG11_big_fil_rev_8_21_14_0_20_47_16]